MTLARASRLLLAFAALLIVVWSFGYVGYRAVARWRSAQDRPVALTVMHWGEQAEDAVVEQLIERYQRENPRVQISRINAGATDFRSKLKTMMAAGTPPDVFYLPPDALAELATLKVIEPFDEFIRKDIAAGGAETKKLYDDFFPILMDAYRFDAATGNVGSGPLYGLPKDFTTSVFYVNVDLFQKAGVRVPYEGWTWDEFSEACRKITALSQTPEFAGRRVYGSSFDLWPDTLRQIVWSFGGDFFGPGGFKDVALDSPASQEALEFIRRVRFDEKTVYNNTGVSTEGKQEFFTGNIGCIGPYGRWMTPRYASISNFKWDIVPVPSKTPNDRANQIFYTAWTMSAKTKHPDECFKLVKFLCGGAGAVDQSRLGLAIPPLKSVAYSADFLAPPGLPKFHSQIFLDAIQHARLQQLPRDAELWNRLVDDETKRVLALNVGTTAENAANIERLWLQELGSPLRQREWRPVRWDVVGFSALSVLAALAALLWWRARREHLGPLDRAIERTGYAFILPWVIGFVALTLGPMVVSLLLSFTRWSGMTPISGALGVGTANYRELFTRDEKFYQSLWVTLHFVLLSVPLSQAAALAVAVLMNVKVRGIAVYRTIFFVPSLIVASVVGAVMWRQMYNNEYGIVNAVLRPILSPLGATPPDWFGTDAARWAIPAFVLMSIWGVGGAMILYLAGLKGIPTSLYEAATIDGAGRGRQFWNVTLPMLSPLIFYNVVMSIIGSFQVFVQAMVMTGGGPDGRTLFYVLQLYRQAFEFHNMGYASAMAWVLFVLLLGLTILIFRASKNLVYYEGLKT
ncbi:MAG TPA: extracellular solute-binding protein [Tepidisphaeraceae bacterium]|nr:extracellular solute-binding protein [Tepidisphaeraceae bacterium]